MVLVVVLVEVTGQVVVELEELDELELDELELEELDEELEEDFLCLCLPIFFSE